VYLLETTKAGVLVNTVNVVGRRTVEGAVCQIRTEAVGSAFMEWWKYGNNAWQFHVPTADGGAVPVDLRKALLVALEGKGRRSYIAKQLKVLPDGRSLTEPATDPVSVGRDLLDWHDTYGPSYKCGRLCLAVLINHAWHLYHAKKGQR
jgi:hypothetical protein